MATDFNNLFIFEMANNHEGDVGHGLAIIREFGALAREEGVRAAIKFQFRDIDTFIHPDFKARADVKHVDRFTRTKLELEEFSILLEETRRQGLVAVCTPFDEISVERILELNFDIIKVGSCSAADTPLLEKVAESGKPVIASTAGLDGGQIDRLARILGSRGTPLALMHCVALYPTPSEALGLGQIDVLKQKYPRLTIGFSTHEHPDNKSAVQMAYAKGARIFERHVGIETAAHKLNAYSSSPEQTRHWIRAFKEAVASCDDSNRNGDAELGSLRSLMRGVYAAREISKGSMIRSSDVFFAMPLQPGQLASGDWRDGLVADRNYPKNAFLSSEVTARQRDRQRVGEILERVRAQLKKARIAVGPQSLIEVSHHYGLDKFAQFGAVFATWLDKESVKKLVVQLPGQTHPRHKHSRKEETFRILAGDLEILLGERRYRLVPGDTLVIPRNEWHSFHTVSGAIFEETIEGEMCVSIYEDDAINRTTRERRVTPVVQSEPKETAMRAGL